MLTYVVSPNASIIKEERQGEFYFPQRDCIKREVNRKYWERKTLGYVKNAAAVFADCVFELMLWIHIIRVWVPRRGEGTNFAFVRIVRHLGLALMTKERPVHAGKQSKI